LADSIWSKAHRPRPRGESQAGKSDSVCPDEDAIAILLIFTSSKTRPHPWDGRSRAKDPPPTDALRAPVGFPISNSYLDHHFVNFMDPIEMAKRQMCILGKEHHKSVGAHLDVLELRRR
jgi:hypothetical protein